MLEKVEWYFNLGEIDAPMMDMFQDNALLHMFQDFMWITVSGIIGWLIIIGIYTSCCFCCECCRKNPAAVKKNHTNTSHNNPLTQLHMLRLVCFKNFVKFKSYQVMNFSRDGPFILIGENGSGKSSVFEGIRRCLKSDLSTSISSVNDPNNISYFICKVGTDSPQNDSLHTDDIIFGIVTIPKDTIKQNIEGNKTKAQYINYWYYKFALSKSIPLMVDLIDLSKGKTYLNVSKSYVLSHTEPSIKDFILAMSKQNPCELDIENCIKSIFEKLNVQHKTSNKLETFLCTITEQFVFTFPLRSIGPLQWSESSRISNIYRKKNYEEAEKRCEIIKYFLENGEKFDKENEKEYFEKLSESGDYDFTLQDGKIVLSNGKFELLKTPEGIIEAKTFSIILSSKQYTTILLEEPDKGMHPQLIEKIVHTMKQLKSHKRVILTTHQKAFISPWTVLDTFIFRRGNKGNRIISGYSIFGGKKDASMKKMRLLTSHHIQDIFFAKKVLFFEGHSEEIFLWEVKRQVLTGESKIALNLFNSKAKAYKSLQKSLTEHTFINMNSKYNRKLCENISIKLGIDHVCLVDRDAVSDMIHKEDQTMKGTQLREKWKIERDDLLKRKRLFFWLDGTIEKMVFENMFIENPNLKSKLEKQNVTEDRRKFLLHEDVTNKNVTECVRLLLDNCKPSHDLATFIKMLAERDKR